MLFKIPRPQEDIEQGFLEPQNLPRLIIKTQINYALNGENGNFNWKNKHHYYIKSTPEQR
jgi:hypothetical protein